MNGSGKCMSIRITHKSLSNIYSVLLAWSPILGIYRSFVPGVSIAEFLLIVCAMLYFLLSKKMHYISSFSEMGFLCFTIYSIVVTVISALIGSWFELYWLQRVIRFSFYSFCILYISKGLFEEDIFLKNINRMSWLLFFGIIAQYLLYYTTGQYIRLYDHFLPLVTDELREVNYEYIFSYSVFRPSSFLTEPSHIAKIAVIGFAYNIYLSSKLKEWKYYILTFVIGLTVLLSKSLWGYYLIAIIILLWVIDNVNTKHSRRWYVLLPIALTIGTFFVLRSSFWSETFSRLDIYDLQGSAAFTGRFTGYEEFFKLPLIRMVFGSGFGAVLKSSINNSVLFILVGEGIIGIILITAVIISLFRRINLLWKRTLCIAFCFLLFGSNIFFSLYLCMILSLLLNKLDDKYSNIS